MNHAVLSPSGLSSVLGAANPAPILDRNWSLLNARFGLALMPTGALDSSAAPAAVQANFDALAGALGLTFYPVVDAADPEVCCQANFEIVNGGAVVPPPPPPVRLTCATWAPAVVGQPFGFDLTASGPVASFGADIPGAAAWLTRSGGHLAGTPATAGNVVVTMRVSGTDGSSDAKALTIAVSPAGPGSPPPDPTMRFDLFEASPARTFDGAPSFFTS